MRIAYVFHLVDGPEGGVFKKIVDQSLQWIQLGADVFFYILTTKAQAGSFTHNTHGIPTFVYGYGGIAERFKKLSQLYAQIIRDSASIVYHRYDLFHSAFKKITGKIPVIMEINSDDISEYRLGSHLRYWYNRFTRRHIFSNVKGLVFVSQQLSEKSHFADFGKPYLVIGNSIDLQRFRNFPVPENPDPVLVFLGSAKQPWNGIDKIFWIAQHFNTWRFDVIGPNPTDFSNVPRNVTIHGFLSQAQYEPLIAKADVAIGPLSLHIINNDESSPLKIREYLAYGLPVIICSRDTDFPDGAPFLLQLSNEPDNVKRNISEIGNFVNEWRNKRIPREAVNFLDVRVKEKKRVAFLARFSNI